MSLRAPIAIPVEVRAPSRRVFRLAWNVGEDGVRLERAVPFELGRPVDVRLTLPDAAPGTGELALRAEVRAGEDGENGQEGDDGEDQATELSFLNPPAAAREALRRYVHQRLGLPT